jgi:hypothetical protein
MNLFFIMISDTYFVPLLCVLNFLNISVTLNILILCDFFKFKLNSLFNLKIDFIIFVKLFGNEKQNS